MDDGEAVEGKMEFGPFTCISNKFEFDPVQATEFGGVGCSASSILTFLVTDPNSLEALHE